MNLPVGHGVEKPKEEFLTLRDAEKAYILGALQRFNNNKMQAAHALGISIKTIYNKLHSYGLFDEYRDFR